MRRFAVGLLAIVALAACGTDEPGASTEPGEPSDATGTDLTITVLVDQDAEPDVMTLTCDPPGGSHPDAEAACAQLAESGTATFEPVPADRACTKIYGGPQTATIEGTYDGQTVDAAFSRADGCEIDRWDALGTEVFSVPLQ